MERAIFEIFYRLNMSECACDWRCVYKEKNDSCFSTLFIPNCTSNCVVVWSFRFVRFFFCFLLCILYECEWACARAVFPNAIVAHFMFYYRYDWCQLVGYSVGWQIKWMANTHVLYNVMYEIIRRNSRYWISTKSLKRHITFRWYIVFVYNCCRCHC